MIISATLTFFTGFRPMKQKWRFCIIIAALLSTSVLRAANAAENVVGSESVDRNQETAVEDRPSDSQADWKLRVSQIEVTHMKAFLLLDEGSIEEAVETQRHCVSLCQNLVGNSHWRTKAEEAFLGEMQRVAQFDQDQMKTYLGARNRLWRAERQYKSNEHDEAEKSWTEALQSFSRLFVKDTFSLTAAWECLGIYYMNNGELEKAKEHLIRANIAKQTIYGISHPEYANTLGSIGVVRATLKELDQAEVDLREALRQERKFFGAQSTRYVDALIRLSRVMIDKGRLPEAEAMSLQAMAISQQNGHAESVSKASNLCALADVYIALEEFDRAEIHIQQSLILYEGFFPLRNPSIPMVMERYVVVLRKLGRNDEATEIENRAKAILAQGPSYLSK
jgi:tetratricopeptide (TPR) repeat protein